MIAIENNLGGRVAEVHSLIRNSDLQIIDEHFQPINHHLLAVKGASLETITTVYSHEQALDQCRGFLRSNGLHRVVYADTAGAARMVSENKDITIAALASEIAGNIYDLESLVVGAQDQKGNTTRFVVLSKTQAYESALADRPCMMSLIFKVKSVPAGLYKALGGFATNGVNMVKLESYIANNQFEQAEFYAEIEGHIDDEAVKLSLDELRFFSHEVKIMGVYPKHSHRLR
jgi:prephenate dehydratase